MATRTRPAEVTTPARLGYGADIDHRVPVVAAAVDDVVDNYGEVRHRRGGHVDDLPDAVRPGVAVEEALVSRMWNRRRDDDDPRVVRTAASQGDASTHPTDGAVSSSTSQVPLTLVTASPGNGGVEG